MENFDDFKNSFGKTVTDSKKAIDDFEAVQRTIQTSFSAAISNDSLYEAFDMAKGQVAENRIKFLFEVIECATKLGDVVIAKEAALLMGINLDICRLERILKFNLERERLDAVKTTLICLPSAYRNILVDKYVGLLTANNRRPLADKLLYLCCTVKEAPKTQNSGNGNSNRGNQRRN